MIEYNYYQLLSDIEKYSPSTTLLVHGYAHARPAYRGIYLGKYFCSLGFDLLKLEEKAMSWQIVGSLVDAFNAFLTSFAAQRQGKVKYFDFRPVVKSVLGPPPPSRRTFGVDADWFDYELHPSPEAAVKMAALYAPTLPAMAVAAA
jgi:hypothetical protein